jgi:hypothetical protein
MSLARLDQNFIQQFANELPRACGIVRYDYFDATFNVVLSFRRGEVISGLRAGILSKGSRGIKR